MKKTRKILGFFLALCLVFPIIPRSLYAKDSNIKLEKNTSEKTSKKTGEVIKKFSKSVTENKENDIQRIIESKEASYTVIVVDMSRDMDEKAGEEQRKSVKNFYKSIIKANSENKVALIALDSITTLNTSKVICEFTGDLEKLEEAMEQNTTTFGRSFIDYGLKKSEDLFEEVEEEKGKIVKNIIICSNGIPTAGEKEREKGIYSQTDNENYKFANEVYNVANKVKEKGISIYTVGFFQNLNEKELAFGKRLMKDIAGKGEYKESNNDSIIRQIVENKEPSYTVIVVDMTDSMDGRAIEKERKAVKNFYKSIIKANSENKVALIALSSLTTLNTSKVICEFTNDLEKLEGAMEQNTSTSGNSFMDYGLNKSEDLFEEVEEEKGRVVKNIIICSDGIPSEGKKNEKGIYSEADNENYKFANEAYNVAKKLKEKGISIYTAGFFQNLEEKDLAFGERFMKDIAGKGEYKENKRDINDNIKQILESKESSYTAIIVDMSNNMDGRAGEKERKAVRKFYKSIIKANSENKVALISIDSTMGINTSHVICEFTNDLEKLEEGINDSTVFLGRSFLDYGLNKSKELFDKVEEEKGRVVKNIVVCSDGIPTGGEKETEEGLYSEADNENYKIANEAYNVAKKLKEQGISIYTAGFFQNLEEKDLAFGERFLKDIAGKGEYKEDSNDNNNKDNNKDNENNKTDDKDNNDNSGNSNDDKDKNHSNKDNKDNKNNNGNNQGHNNGNNNGKNSGKDNNSGENNGNVNPDDDKKDPEDNESEHGNDEKPDYSREDTDPIIIIPGIMGSRLFISEEYNDDTKAWDPRVKFAKSIDPRTWFYYDVRQLNERLNMNNPLYVRPCENQQKYSEGEKGCYEREYGAISAYKTLVDSICKRFPNREVYVFSYDWRKSNEVSAEKLNEEIQKILQETGKKKVDIVAHSMGGLVASSYYSKFGSEKVDKIITCGTPYEGAPSLINSVLSWQVVRKPQDIISVDDLGLAFVGGMTREIKSSFDGVAELTPTKNYVSKFPMKEAYVQTQLQVGGYVISYEDYVTRHCYKIFGKEKYLSALNFQNSILENGYNNLLNYYKSYFLIGTNHKTISSIAFHPSSKGVSEKYYELDLRYSTLGDGTVPYYSASISEQLEDLQYYTRVKISDENHGNIVEKKDCIDWILYVLSGESDSGSSEVSGLRNNQSNIVLSKESLAEQYYAVIRVSGPVDITTTMANEELSSDENNLKLKSKYGRLDLLGEKRDIKMLCLDENSDINIKLIGKDTGTMSYTIRYFDRNDKLLDERTFEISVTKDMVIKTGINKDKDTVLQIDKNKDGKVDEKISASKNENIKK